MNKVYTLEECVAFKNIRNLVIASDNKGIVMNKLKDKHDENDKDDVFYSLRTWVDGKVKWAENYFHDDEV